MKIIKYISILIVLYHCILSYAQANNSFLPWNSEVAVADENIRIKTISKKRIVDVYNAPQGGAYFLIKFFQIVISPQDGPNCRFRPTCSAYGKIAVLRYGALVGAILVGDRLIRCNPYSPPGDDPVPKSIIK